jgi:hypothetical protein
MGKWDKERKGLRGGSTRTRTTVLILIDQGSCAT